MTRVSQAPVDVFWSRVIGFDYDGTLVRSSSTAVGLTCGRGAPPAGKAGYAWTTAESFMSKPDSITAEYPLGPALDFLQRLWQLNHALEKLSSRMEKHLGLTAQQRLIVRCIGKYPGQTAGQLAKLLHVDPGTVSAALNRLELKGLLERRRDPRDRRRASLGLTAKGRKLDRPAQGTVEDAVDRLLRSGPNADIQATKRVIGKLAVLLGEQKPE
jgi:DNA-binding MarR family transcriptional regulator